MVDEDRFTSVHAVAGADAGYDPQPQSTWAAVAMLTLPELQPVAASSSRTRPFYVRYTPLTAH